ncbi:MAG TPA: 3-deoxy-7-phosphoheptulonate synthase [Blastocatellia bacterium]|nr:3-deoxy-7-phosphoheptulonate synthase [Blastocatellia bacterium]
MIIVMEEGASEGQIAQVVDRLVKLGFDVHRSTGERHTVLGAVGARDVDSRDFELLEGVHEVLRISVPYKLASRHFKPEGTKIRVKDLEIGGEEVIMMAGPCTIESEEQVETIADYVAKCGARVLRGGAFKPRTSPYSFQGMGEEGLRYLRRAADRHGLLAISEVMESSQIPMFLRYVDILQVGARNMQNFNLLKDLGRINKPVLLKRGPAATIEETLLSAEYILAGGNHQVILCERGIKTFETYTRNTLDISAIPVFHKLSHLPVVADPSHGTGRRDKVVPMARAAFAAGADGLLIEVHHSPETALCDGAQSLLPDQFEKLMDQLGMMAPAIERTIAKPVAA